MRNHHFECPECNGSSLLAEATVSWKVTGERTGYWVFTGYVNGPVQCNNCGHESEDVTEWEET